MWIETHFFAEFFFPAHITWKKSVALHKFDFVGEVMLGRKGGLTNMPFSITYSFKLIFELTSEDCIYLTKFHKSFFNSSIRHNGGEVHSNEYCKDRI